MQRIWFGKQPSGRYAFGFRNLGFVWEHGAILLWFRKDRARLGYKLIKFY
jgi:hypothetical protein